MQGYDHGEIEKKWREKWESDKGAHANDEASAPKTYLLVEFPFPSGEGLHVGHVRGYTALDIVARKRRRQGENVLFPIGWDAFGLPTENYAIKVGRDPREVTRENTDNYRAQMKRLGLSFDWSREANTTDPKYYKWTQWIFLQLYKHGLAYKATSAINWCPKDKIGLANEEVIDGKCERCGTSVEKREREQWMLAITKYADRLYDDLDTVNYIERAKAGQRNWIGKSTGAEIAFQLVARRSTPIERRSTQEDHLRISASDLRESATLTTVKVFTTRPDTIFGATYMVLAPEHHFLTEEIRNPKSEIRNIAEVEAYIQQAAQKEDIERLAEGKEKTGVRLEGIVAINPATKEEIPVYVADYVLGSYGTGAVMAVPAHDERDYAFAKKYGLPMKPVIMPQRTYVDENAKEYYLKRTVIHRDLLQEIARDARNASKNAVVHGGWGIALHVGQEFREIEDIDMYVAPSDIDWWFEYFQKKDFQKNTTSDPAYFQMTRQDTHIDLVVKEKIAELPTVICDFNGEEARVLAADHIIEKKKKDDREIRWKEHADFLMLGIEPYTGEGALVDSGEFSGMESAEARKKIVEYVGGTWTTKYKLRDWVFSRQRYWGEPIPMVMCGKCEWVPVPESELPVTLPHVERYEPTDTGDSPLAKIEEWVHTTCPQCGGPAKRETDVMPNWAGSSWYYLRYIDPKNDEALAAPEKLSYWLPVDWYNGGMEHTTLHLLYSRFWHKFLYDIGVVPTPEPYAKRTSHGLVLAEGGEKMSKSKGNVVNPDDVAAQFGADTLRVYEMFMGPFDQAIAWSTDGLVGVRRFLERVVRIKDRMSQQPTAISQQQETLMHQTIKKVTDDIESLRMNTAVSSLMIFTNALEKEADVSKEAYETLILLLAPLAPFLAEELWEGLGHDASVHAATWPAYDPEKLIEAEVEIAVQINGKVRGTITCARDSDEATVLGIARSLPELEKWLNGKDIVKTIYVANRILNIIIREA